VRTLRTSSTVGTKLRDENMGLWAPYKGRDLEPDSVGLEGPETVIGSTITAVMSQSVVTRDRNDLSDVLRRPDQPGLQEHGRINNDPTSASAAFYAVWAASDRHCALVRQHFSRASRSSPT